jgi:membrane protease YdiL (CAAX protease family)
MAVLPQGIYESLIDEDLNSILQRHPELRWVIGILTSAFIFAVIHPQGWAGVPAIMALAAGFSLLRMWRQSLIAPMTAHALNNGLVCVMMLLL